MRKKTKNPELEYQVNICFDARDDHYVARVPELENCHSHGETAEEALTNAREAIALWLETAKKKRLPIPLPISRRSFSGKFVLRTSVDLHAKLAQTALAHGKSMNDLVVEILQKSV